MTMTRAEMEREIAEHGFFVCPSVLGPELLERVRAALDKGIEQTKQGYGTHIASLDPNAANIRVNNLPAVDPVFIDLLLRDDVLEAVRACVGDHLLVSNFTANVALPGSGSMRLHSDQALVVPPPWPHAWAMNIIWCLDDVHDANGATRYLPGSHRYQSFEEVPEDAMARTLPFEAPAGSFIAMEGRLWHTSGENRTEDEQRRMMFAYYSSDFIRQQMNWTLTLPPAVQEELSPEARTLFGLAPTGNTRIGQERTRLQPTG